ncbi:MAG TPA: trypsin-like peptidase domain-containing protein [Candidatus Dormibacteraeota bacterium]|nr:trypsin-like peptidase domain-containing protein [Candidatus Dormibacteraeota bacterium]
MSTSRSPSKTILVVLLLSVIVLGSVAVYYGLDFNVESAKVVELQNTVSQLRNQDLISSHVMDIPAQQYDNNISVPQLNPVAIYESSNRSVATIEGAKTVVVDTLFGPQQAVESVIGSGFVISGTNSDYVITNFHVVDGTVNSTVTFWNGDAFPAKIVGTDAFSDLAVLSIKAPRSDLHPLEFTSSSSLAVGMPVVAIGNPFGLSGSITFGIVSQLGRTIQYQSTSGTFTIADAIQFSAPINPGNSGGPLLNMYGGVVGITSADVSGSQGVGFAIPSDTILRELPYLIDAGKYIMHPYIGIDGVGMNYQLSQLAGANVTYGVLIEKIDPDSPAAIAGLEAGQQTITVGAQQYVIGGDVVVAMNGTRIVNYDALLTYLERYTLPGQTIFVTIIRSGKYQTIQVTVGTQPT